MPSEIRSNRGENSESNDAYNLKKISKSKDDDTETMNTDDFSDSPSVMIFGPKKNHKSKKVKDDQELVKEINSEKQHHSPCKEKSPKKDAVNKKFNELEKLYSFMMKYKNESKKRTGNNLPWTHSMTYDPYGSYNIPEDLYSKFIKLYEDAIVAGYTPHITEKHKEYGPIVIDLDFVQDKEHKKRCYTGKTITNILTLYNRVIRKYLNVNSGDCDVFVCEKKEPTLRKGEYHDGIHIVYPYICTKPAIQMLMRSEFLILAEKYKTFRKIPLVNSLDSVFDKHVIFKTGWMLYGSTKDASSLPYVVTHIYMTTHKLLTDTLLPGEDIKERRYIKHFINALSCRRFYGVEDITPLADNIDPVEVDSQINKLKENMVEGPNKKAEIATLLGEDTNFIKIVSEDLYVDAKNLVKLFSKTRATEYYKWYQVGRCLHNIDHRLLEDWIEFSKKCPNKFKPGECEKLWKKMKSSNYSIATLHFFASQDNPDKYLKLKEEGINKLIKEGLEASHGTIAKLILEKHKFKYRCASIKHNVWYEFKNHRWIEIDSAYSLRNLISNELTKEYSKLQSYLYDLSIKEQGYDREKCINEANHISKVIRKLNDSTFKNGVIRACADFAYDPNFLKDLDENTNLLCFENGVYDLETDNFRDGCPDDYISLSTGYNYVDTNDDDEYSMAIYDFFSKIQPDPEMRRYLFILLSTCLSGSITEQSFYVFTGSGANGKSKLMELLKYTLGDYFKPMDVRVLTEKRSSSSSASPEVADKKGIRACPFDEPKATDEINTSFMKIFTGGDQIMARALFKDPIYYRPQFKPFLLCNTLPNIKADDEGTWRRLKAIPFPSKFIKKSEITKNIKKYGLAEGQFWADDTLVEKLPEWKQNFMSILIKYYRIFRREGLVHPKIVTQYTEKYRRRCDEFQDFFGDYLQKTDNEKDSITVMDLYRGMRSWHKANCDGKGPNAKDLRNYLKQKMPTFDEKKDSLTKYKLKSQDGDGLVGDLGMIE